MRRLMSLVVLPLCLALAAGCTTRSEGEPAPATTGVETPGSSATDGSEPSADLPSDGAPAVPDPLDTTGFQQDPCQALTRDQSDALDVGPAGKRNDGPLGNGCEWANAETRGQAVIEFLDDDPRGLSALYRANKDGKWAYFEELTPIEGYPAVARDLQDDRNEGYCSIVIGVTDEVAFETFLHLSQQNVGKKDPCEVATQVAGMALQTMKRGA